MLHKPGSVREVGTLKYFREKYNRRNVTPEKVTRSFEGSEQFLLTVGKAYLLEAAMTFWGMEELNGHPTQHVPLPGITNKTKGKKLEYFDEVIGEFVDEFVVPNPDKEYSSCQTDINEENDRVRFGYSIFIYSYSMY